MSPAILLAAPAVPLLLAAGLAVRPLRPALVALAPWAALPALCLSLGGAAGGVAEVPWLLLGSRIGLDATGRVFLLFTAMLWLAAGIYGRSYLAEDGRRGSFFGFFLLAMSGNVGLILAQDVLSFLLFFSLMSFSSYGLIVHDRRPESMRAGRVYVTLVVAGEMLLYSAIVLAVTSAGSAASATRAAPAAGPPDRLVAALFLAGFGIKAGMVPLHVWLPLAHPVAPTPASAVLSGAMIKAGLLGWLRFLPLGEAAHPGLGGVCVVLGFTSAFYGALVGLTQRDPKTVLAYSSVSQMGLMTLPVGVALVSPAHAGPALSAVVLFALHHALAKGSLFLGVGLAAVPPASRAGRALLGLGLVFPALALAGPTLTSGAVAKAGLKTALAASGMGGDLAISLLSAATVGTTLLMARYLVLVWPRAAEGAHRRAAGPGMSLPFAALVAAVAAAVWLVPWGDLRGAVRASAEVAPKWEVLWPVLAGTALAVPALRSGLPRAPGIPPGDLVVPAARGLARLGAGWLRLVGAIERALEAGRSRLIEPAARAVRAAIASGAGLEQALLRWEVGAVAFLIVSLALLASLALC